MKFSLEEILEATRAKCFSRSEPESNCFQQFEQGELNDSDVGAQAEPSTTGAKVLKNEVGVNEKFTLSTDTRSIKSGEIYLPLKGENFDGEDFIDKALDAGAIGYFTTRGEEAKRRRGVENEQNNDASAYPRILSSPLILQVEDTLTAYLELARFYKRKISPKTIAITGSSGKTTTKEMAYCVVKEKFKTHKSELNFNNEIGVCKTILSMPEDTEVLILEMGMRGLGEIELLSKYSEPDITIIANVGTAHIGRLGSRENIATAKCEIVKHMKEEGVLIAHDDELIKQEIGNMKWRLDSAHSSQLTAHAIYFSLNDVRILDRKIGYSKFIYKNHEYEVNAEGDYNIQNSLAAIELGLELGISEEEIASGLKKYLPLEKRGEVQEIKGYKFINDSYNANPESMKAVIKTVLDIYTPPLLLVLGDMGELGEKEVEYHQEVGDFLLRKIEDNKDKNIEAITVGKLANEITKILNKNGVSSVNFEDNLQTSRYILDNVKFGTTIILKASRSMKFEEIIEKVKSKKPKAKG